MLCRFSEQRTRSSLPLRCIGRHLPFHQFSDSLHSSVFLSESFDRHFWFSFQIFHARRALLNFDHLRHARAFVSLSSGPTPPDRLTRLGLFGPTGTVHCLVYRSLSGASGIGPAADAGGGQQVACGHASCGAAGRHLRDVGA